MHSLLFITLTMSAVATSHDARDEAYSRLIDDCSFCGDCGRFGLPLCDRFVLGGRWSGYLSKLLLGKPYKDAFEQEFPQFTNRHFPSSLVEHQKNALNQCWQRFGGTGSHPLIRSSNLLFGEVDDAMLVDQALYDHLLKPLAGMDVCLHKKRLPDFADLDGDEVDESFIGRKWLVVVDCHS